MRKFKLKRNRSVEIALVLIAWQLTWIIPLYIKAQMDNEVVVDITVETQTETELIQWKDETHDVTIEENTEDIVMTPTEEETELPTESETQVESEEFQSISFIPVEIQKLCFEIGEEYQIAPELLIAIIERESGGNVNAKNKVTGCMGLMQLHPKYAYYYLDKAGCSNPYNAEDNIRAGCEILIEKFEEYTDLPLVLMKYHGESNALKNFKRGKYSNYCKGIIKRMEEMQEITGG